MGANKFRVGIDIHGTIDTEPEFFSMLMKIYRKSGVEVHITTGVKITQRVIDRLAKWKIEYDRLFSITDYHESIGTKIIYDEKGNPWIEDEIWDRTKADYCKREGIHLHIDDSPVYGRYFTTPYLQFKTAANEVQLC